MPVCRWSLGVPGPDCPDRISALQADFRFGRNFIRDTERRGITLRQIDKIVGWAMKSSQEWFDASPTAYSQTGGCRITEDNLNLYTANTWLIMPATRTPLQIGTEVFVKLSESEQGPWQVGKCKEWVSAGGHWLTKLDEGCPRKVELTHTGEEGGQAQNNGLEEQLSDDTWRETMLKPGASVSFHTGQKGILVEWIPPSGHWIVEVDGHTVNVAPKLLAASTGAWQCAFVEVLALADQPPRWFVSHWWGEPVVHFAACLRLHAATRLGTVLSQTGLDDGSGCRQMEADEDSPYWVCAYANRQWNLAGEVVMDPKKTSFYKAIGVAKSLGGGTLLILDDKNEVTGTGPGTPFSRVWCAFEEYTSINLLHLPLDIAAYHNKKAELLTSEATKQDRQRGDTYANANQSEREKTFPVVVLEHGMALQLEKAKATEDADRVHILNAIAAGGADLSEDELNKTPPSTHDNYDKVNKQLGSLFAVAAWRQGIESQTVHMQKLSTTLKADSWRSALTMDFCNCKQFDDAALVHLASSFPLGLTSLTLGMQACTEIGDIGVEKLGAAMAKLPLTSLSLNFRLCDKIGDIGLEKLASAIAKLPLTSLSLDFWDTGITKTGVTALARNLPVSVTAPDIELDYAIAGHFNEEREIVVRLARESAEEAARLAEEDERLAQLVQEAQCAHCPCQ